MFFFNDGSDTIEILQCGFYVIINSVEQKFKFQAVKFYVVPLSSLVDLFLFQLEALASSSSLILFVTQVSSGKFLSIENFKFLSRAIMRTRKRRGPYTLPCETPEVTCTDLDLYSFTTTDCVLSVMKNLIQLCNLPSTLTFSNFSSSTLKSTLSKALAKSR